MRAFGRILALMLALIFIMTLIILQPSVSSAQTLGDTSAPAIQWQQQYGDNSVEEVSNLIQTSDGGYAFLDLG